MSHCIRRYLYPRSAVRVSDWPAIVSGAHQKLDCSNGVLRMLELVQLYLRWSWYHYTYGEFGTSVHKAELV